MSGDPITEADIHLIQRIIPHRYPFLLIDKVRDIVANEGCVGIKNVTMNEPHFQGHFPGHPVMPGVLIVEAMAQTAGAICIRKSGMDTPSLVYFMAIDGAKFRKPVTPGDQLRIHVTKQKERGGIFRYACEALVDGVKVAEAQLTAMMTPKQSG